VVSRKETIDLVDLVSVFEKLIQSPNAFVIVGFTKNRFVDGRYAGTIAKLMIKVFYYGISRNTKKKGLMRQFGRKGNGGTAVRHRLHFK
jgi:hypothetical protein